jgi:hypothetical protein
LTAAPYALTYAAPADCPTDDAFRHDVASRLHDESPIANVRLDVAIEANDARFRGTITALDEGAKESARRQIEGESCLEVAHAMAFLAALALELNGHLDPDSEPSSAPSSPPPVPPRQPVGQAAPVLAPSRVASVPGVRVSALLLGDARDGFGPSVEASGEAGAELASVGNGTLSPAARFVAFAGRGSLGSPAGSARLWFGGGRLELCPIRIGATPLTLRVCAGGELGAVHAQGEVPFEPRAATVPWVTAEATLRLQWFATRALFVELGGGPVLPLDRTRYYFRPDTTLYQAPALGARLALGLGWQF